MTSAAPEAAGGVKRRRKKQDTNAHLKLCGCEGTRLQCPAAVLGEVCHKLPPQHREMLPWQD